MSQRSPRTAESRGAVLPSRMLIGYIRVVRPTALIHRALTALLSAPPFSLMLQRFVSATRGVVTTRALATITARPALVSSSRSVARCFSVDAAVEAVAPAPVAAPAAPPAAAVSTRINRSRRFGTLLARASQTPAVDDLTWPTHEIGERGTLEWRMQFARTRRSSPVPVPYSPWHSIPLLVAPGEQFLRYVNEIPKGTRPKMEIATKEEYNPIKQVRQQTQRARQHADAERSEHSAGATANDLHPADTMASLLLFGRM